ncbi:MAG: hypothetical protein Tsb0018_10000 [Opitutales bacterium]
MNLIRNSQIIALIMLLTALLLSGPVRADWNSPTAVDQYLSDCSPNDFVCELLETYTNDKKYSEVCWLTTHNAFATPKQGWNYSQQNLDFEEQYTLGVRSFMIDLYLYNPGDSIDENGEATQGKSYIAMCHEPHFLDGRNCLTTNMFLKNGAPDALLDFLLQVKEWLNEDPDTIITLIIESRFGEDGAAGALYETFKQADLVRHLYVPQVDPKEIQDWPTLGDLRNVDRRLIVFSDNINDEFIHTSTYRETRFDLGKYPKCEMREDGRDTEKMMPLFALNHFYGISVRLNGFWKDYEKINAYQNIIERVNLCETEHNMLPNFLVMDFVEEGEMGGALQAVIEINLKSKDRFQHDTMHFPLNQEDLLLALSNTDIL